MLQWNTHTHTHLHTHICSKQIILAGGSVLWVCTGLSSKEDNIVKIAVFPAGSSCFLLKVCGFRGFHVNAVIFLCFNDKSFAVEGRVWAPVGHFAWEVLCWKPCQKDFQSYTFSTLPFCQGFFSVSASLAAVWTLHCVGPEPFPADTGGDFAAQSFMSCLMWDKNPSISSSLCQFLQQPTNEPVSRLISQMLENFQENVLCSVWF